MKKPVLVVMAAGMGSRYGGLKQMDPVDDKGRVILDYSVNDAIRAGFEEVVFIIKPEMEEAFRETVGQRIDGRIKYSFAFQLLDDIPSGYEVPEGRVKPWGTGHAVRSARRLIKGKPFVVINADDYYGRNAYKLIFDFLTSKENERTDSHNEYIGGKNADSVPTYGFVAYSIENTVTENGSVARGVCKADENGYLTEITERTQIEKRPYGAAYTEDGGQTWTDIPAGTPVSMNFWGFTPDFLEELDSRFPKFLDKTLKHDPLKGEYFLPFVVDEVRAEGKAKVKVLHTPDKWYGVTYKEDKPALVEALKKINSEV